jgi:predicted transcriptional regulator
MATTTKRVASKATQPTLDDDLEAALEQSITRHPAKGTAKAEATATKAEALADDKPHQDKLDVSIRRAAGKAETAIAIFFELIARANVDDKWREFRDENGKAFRSYPLYVKDVIKSEMTELVPAVRNALIALLTEQNIGQAVVADIVGLSQAQVSRTLAESRRTPASDGKRRTTPLTDKVQRFCARLAEDIDVTSDEDAAAIERSLKAALHAVTAHRKSLAVEAA